MRPVAYRDPLTLLRAIEKVAAEHPVGVPLTWSDAEAQVVAVLDAAATGDRQRLRVAAEQFLQRTREDRARESAYDDLLSFRDDPPPASVDCAVTFLDAEQNGELRRAFAERDWDRMERTLRLGSTPRLRVLVRRLVLASGLPLEDGGRPG